MVSFSIASFSEENDALRERIQHLEAINKELVEVCRVVSTSNLYAGPTVWQKNNSLLTAVIAKAEKEVS